ncbi:MAG: MobA/MobL family protein [Gammaproteobacteria bacterium]|nr:MobA/MobL family protein [Gammaproteobacteria bacterium]
MASYHLSVKTVKRSAGQSATASAAYRSGESIACEREGRVHDYTAKQGIAETFILAPDDTPSWVQDRAALWNAAEARETRRNSVTAREWELALPSEVSDQDRSQIARDFAQTLVDRYGVVADVAIHAPHREGDQRNHHAHILTTTRVMSEVGLTDKTRVLDAAKTGGVEIEQMRGVWAEMQNAALERAGRAQGLDAGEISQVDHRSLEAQRIAALSRGDEMSAEELDRAPELKLGPAANAMERREIRMAAVEGRDYEPVTERGRAVHAARQARELFAEVRERLELARETYGLARDEGQGRVSAGLAALRTAAGKDRAQQDSEQIRERLENVLGRERAAHNEEPGKDLEKERDTARGRGLDDGLEL